jgi:hypothetical protein
VCFGFFIRSCFGFDLSPVATTCDLFTVIYTTLLLCYSRLVSADSTIVRLVASAHLPRSLLSNQSIPANRYSFEPIHFEAPRLSASVCQALHSIFCFISTFNLNQNCLFASAPSLRRLVSIAVDQSALFVAIHIGTSRITSSSSSSCSSSSCSSFAKVAAEIDQRFFLIDHSKPRRQCCRAR